MPISTDLDDLVTAREVIDDAAREVPRPGNKSRQRNIKRSNQTSSGSTSTSAMRRVVRNLEAKIAKRGAPDQAKAPSTRAWLIDVLHLAINLGELDALRAGRRLDPQTARIIDLACAVEGIHADQVYFKPRGPHVDPDEAKRQAEKKLSGAFGSSHAPSAGSTDAPADTSTSDSVPAAPAPAK